MSNEPTVNERAPGRPQIFVTKHLDQALYPEDAPMAEAAVNYLSAFKLTPAWRHGDVRCRVLANVRVVFLTFDLMVRSSDGTWLLPLEVTAQQSMPSTEALVAMAQTEPGRVPVLFQQLAQKFAVQLQELVLHEFREALCFGDKFWIEPHPEKNAHHPQLYIAPPLATATPPLLFMTKL